MVAAVQSRVLSIPLELRQRLDYFPVSESLVVFKLEWEPVFPDKTAHPGIQVKLPTGTTQGFADARAMTAYAAGRCSAYTRKAAAAEAGIRYSAEELKIEPSTSFSLVPLSFLELVRTQGFVDMVAESAEKFQAHAETAYDLLRTAKASLPQVVRLDYGSHMLFNLAGQPLPVALQFNYLDGRVADGQYDLARLAEKLKADPRVRLLSPKAPVVQVPYYNVSPGCAQHVPFVFSPTAQDMLAMWPVMQRLKPQYPSVARYEAIFELDLLGLREAGIARFDHYWGSPEEPVVEDEDEDAEV